jgi:hypothetical protein
LSPEAKSSAAAVARLLVEIAEDREGLVRRFADAQEAERRLASTPEDVGTLALAAVALHGWYTGLETIFERVARQLDASVPTGERWHRELLSQMTAEIPNVRPPVIDRALLADLGALLGFRHFFRHAYAVTFDAGHLSLEVGRLLRVGPTVDAALDDLTSFLTEVMLRLSEGA